MKKFIPMLLICSLFLIAAEGDGCTGGEVDEYPPAGELVLKDELNTNTENQVELLEATADTLMMITAASIPLAKLEQWRSEIVTHLDTSDASRYLFFRQHGALA